MSRHGQGAARGDVKSARRLWRATYEIEGEIQARRHDGEELVEQAERLVFALRAVRLTSRQSTLEEAVVSELDRLELAAKDDREIPGRVTGLAGLDRLLGGLQDRRLYVIAARPSTEKSLLALQFARHAALPGAPARAVRVAGDERPRSGISRRKAASHRTGCTWGRSRTATGRRSSKRRRRRLARRFISSTMVTLRAQARQVAVRHGDLRLVVVDYLQLLRPTSRRGTASRRFPRSAAA
jgi:replicative DNA helicase